MIKLKKIKTKTLSINRQNYIKKQRRSKIFIISMQLFVLAFFIGLWQILSNLSIIDSFFFSSPQGIFKTAIELFSSGEIWQHIWVTLLETTLGFCIASGIGFLIACMLWWNSTLRKILEPYIIILNSLPKIALGPIIILWVGSGMSAIVTMCVLICVIISTISLTNAFVSCDNDKILLMKSMHANKFQIFTKLILPNSLPSFISMLKINVGMSWVGTIMGEYLSSSKGLGYLIVYGSQVFKIDLVMTSTILLCLLAGVMYGIICLIEKKINKT